MDKKQTTKIRPTKKQRELLGFIEAFIASHGYSPSYREIMDGLDYTSVATVALHVNNLIKRGHLVKRDHSARSLELTEPTQPSKITTNLIDPAQEKWLVEKVEHVFKRVEDLPSIEKTDLEQLAVLIAALKVLGLDGAAQSFTPRYSTVKDRLH